MGISVCRNVKLANVFYRLGLIEAYGTGIRKIMGAYEGTGKKPEMAVSDNAFKIILPNLNIFDDQSENNIENNDQAETVISLAKKQGDFSRKDLQSVLGISQTTAGRLLRQMLDKGLIIQKGSGKNTRYHLAE